MKYIKKMSKNIIIKESLDEYLKKEKILTFDETLNIFFEYVNLNNKIPNNKENYKNINISQWFSNNKVKIKNGKNNIYKKMSKNLIVKKKLDEYLKREKKEKIFTFEETLKIFFEFINENKRVPTQSEKYNNINIGMWLYNQKAKIKSNDDEIYKIMSKNLIVKESLDKYLEREKKEKILTFEETFEIFLEYVSINKKMPTSGVKYKNIRIGGQLSKQKSKIKNNEDNIYKIMSKNLIIKENLDKYLEREKEKKY